jgi:hypothetical protein
VTEAKRSNELISRNGRHLTGDGNDASWGKGDVEIANQQRPLAGRYHSRGISLSQKYKTSGKNKKIEVIKSE